MSKKKSALIVLIVISSIFFFEYRSENSILRDYRNRFFNKKHKELAQKIINTADSMAKKAGNEMAINAIKSVEKDHLIDHLRRDGSGSISNFDRDSKPSRRIKVIPVLNGEMTDDEIKRYFDGPSTARFIVFGDSNRILLLRDDPDLSDRLKSSFLLLECYKMMIEERSMENLFFMLALNASPQIFIEYYYGQLWEGLGGRPYKDLVTQAAVMIGKDLQSKRIMNFRIPFFRDELKMIFGAPKSEMEMRVMELSPWKSGFSTAIRAVYADDEKKRIRMLNEFYDDTITPRLNF